MLPAGRADGLTERVLGCGAVEALVTGTLAARAILDGAAFEGLLRRYFK